MLTMKDIVLEGHPALEQVAKKVDMPPSKEDKQTLEDMIKFVKNSQDEAIAEKYKLRAGVGLAAPQLGISKRMFAVHFEDLDGKLYSDGYFNPKIISHSVEQTFLSSGEGCLSVNRDVPGYVHRYARITLSATNLAGEKIKLRLRGYPAIVYQHELDHLNGIMFYDHINKQDPFYIPENTKPSDLQETE